MVTKKKKEKPKELQKYNIVLGIMVEATSREEACELLHKLEYSDGITYFNIDSITEEPK